MSNSFDHLPKNPNSKLLLYCIVAGLIVGGFFALSSKLGNKIPSQFCAGVGVICNDGSMGGGCATESGLEMTHPCASDRSLTDLIDVLSDMKSLGAGSDKNSALRGLLYKSWVQKEDISHATPILVKLYKEQFWKSPDEQSTSRLLLVEVLGLTESEEFLNELLSSPEVLALLRETSAKDIPNGIPHSYEIAKHILSKLNT